MANPLEILYHHFEENSLWKGDKTLKRGQTLHLPGDRDSDLYYVASGSLYTAVTVEEDREQIIRFGYSGDFFTAIDTFLTSEPTMFCTTAIQRCDLKVIDRATYHQSLRDHEALQVVWDHVMHALVIGQLEREIDLLTTDAAARYQRVWERSPRLFQEIPAKYIANYLRMSPETFSRIRGKSLFGL